MEDLIYILLTIKLTAIHYLIFSGILNIILLLWILYFKISRKKNIEGHKKIYSSLDYDSTRKKTDVNQFENARLFPKTHEMENRIKNLEIQKREYLNKISSLESKIEEYKEGSENDGKIIDELKVDLANIENKIIENGLFVDISWKVENKEILNQEKENSNELAFAKCEVINNIGYLEKTKSSSHQTPYFIEEINGKNHFYLNNKNTDAIVNALNFYNVYIRAFCESENIYNPSIHKSFTAEKDSKGILEKDGEKFRVVEKLKIRFLDI